MNRRLLYLRSLGQNANWLIIGYPEIPNILRLPKGSFFNSTFSLSTLSHSTFSHSIFSFNLLQFDLFSFDLSTHTRWCQLLFTTADVISFESVATANKTGFMTAAAFDLALVDTYDNGLKQSQKLRKYKL